MDQGRAEACRITLGQTNLVRVSRTVFTDAPPQACLKSSPAPKISSSQSFGRPIAIGALPVWQRTVTRIYYHALTAKTMYRIKTEYLLDESLSPVQLAAKVQNLGPTPRPDGMLEGSKGNRLSNGHRRERPLPDLIPARETPWLSFKTRACNGRNHGVGGRMAGLTSRRRRSIGCQSIMAE
jgi:hypothetical protein